MDKDKVEGLPFRNIVSEFSNKFKPESNRYHLYISHACPFAHRASIVLYLKGLEDHISFSVVHPTFQRTKPDVDDHLGWVFKSPTDEPVSSAHGYGSFDCEGCIPDNINNTKSARELYELDGGSTARYTVPILWDKKEKIIVNNESSEIMRMLNSNFNNLASNKELNLYPDNLKNKIYEINDMVYNNINMAVYRCGFAQKQEPYEIAFKELFDCLDKVEEILSKSRFLVGNQITESDIRLFVTLVRFDEVYFISYKCNKKRIIDYPNLLNFCREIYQLPKIGSTVNMKHIKMHYFTNYKDLNTYAIIPKGNNFIAELEKPHNRK